MQFRRVLAIALAVFASATLVFAQVTLNVTSPTNGFVGPSPMKFTGNASTTSSGGMSSMALSVDGTQVYFQWGDSFTAYLWIKTGTHTVVATATDAAGHTASKTLRVRSTSSSGTVSNIDEMTGWQSVTSSVIGGGGSAITGSYPYQTSPSKDGSSREFTLGGTGPYSNAYWYKFIGGSKDAVNFTYDTWVAISDATKSQALELDVNQSFNHARWVFGTQCNFKDGPPLGGYWNVWDGGTGQWKATNVPCKPSQFPANQFQHVVWTVYRTGNRVHYTSVTINGRQFTLNLEFGRQPTWDGADIDVSVQLDGDYNQDPYSVWVDSMKLTAW